MWPSGPTVNLAPPSEGPEMPTLTALDSGLAAVWNSGSTGARRLAILDSGLRVAHGPVSMMTGGASCSDAHVAWLPASRRLVLVATDSKDDTIWRSVWDDRLMPIVPAGKLPESAHWIRIVGDGDGAWIAWIDDSTGSRVRYGRLSSDGAMPRMSVALGQLDDTLGHYHTLQRVGQSAIALWTDATMNRTFSAMRVCF
jgi:hypothetical protein